MQGKQAVCESLKDIAYRSYCFRQSFKLKLKLLFLPL